MSQLFRSTRVLSSLLLFIVIATGQDAAKQNVIVRSLDSPAAPGSGEPNLYAASDGRVFLTWIEPAGSKGHRLRFAIRDGGNWSEPRTIAEGVNWFVNWADFPSLVVRQDGALVAHWLVKSSPDSHAYDNVDDWEIHGCPVNGPSVSADGRRVAVAWFTAAKDVPRVKIIFSSDAGATFGQPIQVDEGAPVGRVDVLMLADGSALVSWLERTTKGGEVKVRRMSPDGSRHQAMTVAESSGARASGFPQMALAGDEIIFAWTDPSTPSKVRTAVGKLVAVK